MAARGIPVGFHAEADGLIFSLIRNSREAGNTSPRAHCQSRPPASETLPVLKLLELAYWTRCRLHLYHVSHPRSVHLLKKFQEEGVDATAETCPHYLVLDEGEMERLKALGKINPPLRNRDSLEEMWELLKDGRIDMVSSEPCSLAAGEEREPGYIRQRLGRPGGGDPFPPCSAKG